MPYCQFVGQKKTCSPEYVHQYYLQLILHTNGILCLLLFLYSFFGWDQSMSQ